MIPEEMKAVHLEREGAPLAVRVMSVPVPGPGQVLIRIAAAPANPSDLAFLAGAYRGRTPLPVVPGLEGSGTVVSSGAGVIPRMLAGRRVAFAAPEGGTWAEYAAVPAMRCIPLRKRVSLEQAAMLIVNPLTALAFFDMARQGRHKAIVSNAAASALGMMIVRMGRAAGIPVVNIVRREAQAESLRAEGASLVLLSTSPDFERELRDLALQLRATLVLDAIGGPESQVLVDAAPAGSTIVVYGTLSGEPSVFAARSLIGGEKTIVGFFLGHWMARKGLVRTVRDVVRVQRLVGSELGSPLCRKVPLAEAQAAIESYRRDMSAGKILLVADPEQVRLS
jgi:NADPH2:quinone reductase